MLLKIFVGDDSVSIRKVIEMAVKDKEWQVKFFNEGDTLFANIKEENPDFLFISPALPGKSVTYIWNFIKENTDIKTKIILMKGAFDEDIESIEKEKYDSFISKPFSSEDFTSIVENLMSDTKSISDIPLPEEEGEYDLPGDVSESFDKSEEDLDTSSDEDIGVYPIKDEEVTPSDEKTKESNSVLKTEKEKKEEKKEEIDNPFIESSFEEDIDEVETSIKDEVEESPSEEENLEVDKEEKVKKEDKEDVEEEVEEEDVDEDLDFSSLDEEEVAVEDKDEKVEEEAKEEFSEKITKAPTQKVKDDGIEKKAKESEKSIEGKEKDKIEQQIEETIEESKLDKKVMEEKETPKKNDTEEIDKEAIRDITKEKIEEVLWEVLPKIAEKTIKSEITNIKEEILKLEEDKEK